MAARSTHVTLDNLAGRFNLRRLSASLNHGEWAVQPPQILGDRAEWESESNGFLTGTEGRVTYQIEDDEGGRVGELRLHWDNPFIGGNSYDESVSPAATSAVDDGFSVVHVGGSGDNARVRFVLLNAFCKASPDGEIACSSASPLTGASATERYAAIWTRSPGPSWHAVHGLSSARYQETFDRLVGQGMRPVHVNGHAVGGEDRYAAIFEQRDGPSFAARHGLTSAQYQQTFDELVRQGFRLTCVSGYAVRGEDRYAAIFEQQGGPAFAARHGLTSAQYQQAFDGMLGEGFRLVAVSGYATG